MTDHPDNRTGPAERRARPDDAGASGTHRCTSCGRVDTPRLKGAGPGWIALALWVAAALLLGTPYLLGIAWPIFPATLVFLAALVYTLWYFARREEACRHCGATALDRVREAGPG